MSTPPSIYEAGGAQGGPGDERAGAPVVGDADGGEPGELGAQSFAAVDEIGAYALMAGLRVRAVHGERITLGIVELAAGLRMAEHRHLNEQVGVVVRGEFSFSVGGETRRCRAGDTWVIPGGVPHSVDDVGAAGCTVVETFSPPRTDWQAMPRETPAAAPWPGP